MSVGLFTGGVSFTRTADSAITAFKAVALTATGCALAGAGTGDNGVTAFFVGDDYATGAPVAIFANGLGKATVNGDSVAIASGDLLKTAAGGVLIKAEDDYDNVVAIALNPATTDGAEITILITQFQINFA